MPQIATPHPSIPNDLISTVKATDLTGYGSTAAFRRAWRRDGGRFYTAGRSGRLLVRHAELAAWIQPADGA